MHRCIRVNRFPGENELIRLNAYKYEHILVGQKRSSIHHKFKVKYDKQMKVICVVFPKHLMGIYIYMRHFAIQNIFQNKL